MDMLDLQTRPLPAWLRQQSACGPACIIYTEYTLAAARWQQRSEAAETKRKPARKSEGSWSFPWPCLSTRLELSERGLAGAEHTNSPLIGQKGCARSSHPTLTPHLELKDLPPRLCPSALVARTTALAHA